MFTALLTLTISSYAQTLLFNSNFENNVSLAPVSGNYSQYQKIQGTDLSTGFSWPLNVFNPHPDLTGIFGIIGSGTPEPISNYIRNTIETTVGPQGTSVKALRMNVLKPSPLICCIQNSFQTAGLNTAVRSVYLRYWIKLGPEIASQVQANRNQFWRAIWEMKTRSDYRIAAYVYGDSSGRPYWYVHGDNNAASAYPYQEYWAVSNTSVPVPVDQWFLSEIYLYRSTGNDGRFFWSVNGQTLADRYGPNYGVNLEQANVLMYSNTYGNFFPQLQWLKSVEIWDRPPCATLPCGTGTAAAAGDTQAPSTPTNLTASAVSSGQINLSWSASTDNVGVGGYRIYRNGGVDPITSTPGTSYQDKSVAASTAYTYTVAAYDAAGNLSGKSSQASAVTPAAPANLVRGKIPTGSTTLYSAQYITDGDISGSQVAGAGSGCQWIQFDLGLTHAVNGVKLWHYFGSADRVYNDVIVQLSAAGDFSSGVSTVFNNDANNSCGVGSGADAPFTETSAGKAIPFTARNARYVRIWSNGSNMNAWNHYTEVEVYGDLYTDIVPPTTPTGLSALAAANQVKLTWNASTDNVGVAGYRVFRNGGTAPIATVTGTVYQDNGVTPSTAYTYTVAAIDAAGNVSQPCAPVSIVTLASANLLRGKTPTSSGSLYDAPVITDGDKSASRSAGAGSGRQWIQFDLGSIHSLEGVRIWHYFGSTGRIYNDVIVQLSNVADFSSGTVTVFNNDTDNSSSQGVGSDAPYVETAEGKLISFSPRSARYIRFRVNGSNMNTWNHYTEVEAYGYR